jgi:hypothetical protein
MGVHDSRGNSVQSPLSLHRRRTFHFPPPSVYAARRLDKRFACLDSLNATVVRPTNGPIETSICGALPSSQALARLARRYRRLAMLACLRLETYRQLGSPPYPEPWFTNHSAWRRASSKAQLHPHALASAGATSHGAGSHVSCSLISTGSLWASARRGEASRPTAFPKAQLGGQRRLTMVRGNGRHLGDAQQRKSGHHQHGGCTSLWVEWTVWLSVYTRECGKTWAHWGLTWMLTQGSIFGQPPNERRWAG